MDEETGLGHWTSGLYSCRTLGSERMISRYVNRMKPFSGLTEDESSSNMGLFTSCARRSQSCRKTRDTVMLTFSLGDLLWNQNRVPDAFTLPGIGGPPICGPDNGRQEYSPVLLPKRRVCSSGDHHRGTATWIDLRSVV